MTPIQRDRGDAFHVLPSTFYVFPFLLRRALSALLLILLVSSSSLVLVRLAPGTGEGIGADAKGFQRDGAAACERVNNKWCLFRMGGFHQPTTSFINFGSGSNTSGVQVKNNITYSGEISVGLTSGVTFSDNHDNTDAKLINPSFRDFHLQSSSPAINAGLAFSEVTTDYDGVSRPQGSAYDIGAYEYTGTPSDTTPPAAPTGVRVK